jgi:hypothetical protein
VATSQAQARPWQEDTNLAIRALVLLSGAVVAIGALPLSSGLTASAPQAGRAMPRSDHVERNLETFDDLDYSVFSNQRWDDLKRSHSTDVVVHWPDGRVTKGIERHIQDLKAMFVYAPDTRIKQHPVKFGSGEWTSVIGIVEGTFTRPMPMSNGTPIAPTGKAFKISMSTVGRWNAQGTMDEEYLFWDNATYMKQLGIGQ